MTDTFTPGSKGYGWKPSPPDFRDYKLVLPENSVSLPLGVDLRKTGYLPEIWDQGQLGSCVSHGVGAAYSFELARQSAGTNFDPSRLFIYYNGRVLEGTVNDDSGLYVRDGIKVLNSQGAPPSTDWPYDIGSFTVKPPQVAYDDGKLREAVQYASVAQNETAMKTVLAAGLPIVVGFTVYESFESDVANSTGQIPMPASNEKVLGGHCVLIVGYGTDKWIVRNSWGTGWGDNGYCYFPIPYFTDPDLSDDFWAVQSVSSPIIPPTPPTPDFVTKAQATADAFHGIAGGDLVFVRDILRDGKLVEKVWKSGGLEIGVKNLHP